VPLHLRPPPARFTPPNEESIASTGREVEA
jgi:hypothetical protein